MAPLQTIGVYYDLPGVLVARSLLEAHGILTFVPKYWHNANAWHFTIALGGMRLCVLDCDAVKATQLLKLPADTQPLKMKFSFLNAIIALLFLIYIGMPFPVRRPVKQTED